MHSAVGASGKLQRRRCCRCGDQCAERRGRAVGELEVFDVSEGVGDAIVVDVEANGLAAAGFLHHRGNIADIEVEDHRIAGCGVIPAVIDDMVLIAAVDRATRAASRQVERVVARTAVNGDGCIVECCTRHRRGVIYGSAAWASIDNDVFDAVHADGAAVRHGDDDVGVVRAGSWHDIGACRSGRDGDRAGGAGDMQRVRARPAVDDIVTIALRIVDRVVAFLREDDVVAGAAGDGVVAAGAAGLDCDFPFVRRDVGQRVGAGPVWIDAAVPGLKFRKHGPARAVLQRRQISRRT